MSDPQERAKEPVRQVAARVERAGVRATERGQNEAPRVELVHDPQAVDAPWLCGIPSGETVRIVSPAFWPDMTGSPWFSGPSWSAGQAPDH